MRNTKKILLALVLTLVFVAVLSVCSFAADFDINTQLPSGVQYGETGWKDSGYSDIDAEGSGWYLMSTTSSAIDRSTTETSYPKFATIPGARFYWNKETNEAVWLVTQNNMNGDSGDGSEIKSVSEKQLWSYAAHFVDIAINDENEFATKFANGATETSKGLSNKILAGSIHERYANKESTDPKKAGTAWWTYFVSATDYAGFVAYKAGLTETGEALEDLLVQYAHDNIVSFGQFRNVLVAGTEFRMAWVFNKLRSVGRPFKTLEFRLATNISSAYYGTVGLVTQSIAAETVLFDSRINKISLTDASRGLMMNNTALKTLAHVEYSDKTGNYIGDVNPNVVDLTGFTKVDDYTAGDPKDTTKAFGQAFYGASAMTEVVFFNSVKDGTIEYAGWLDLAMFSGATSLEKITMTAPLELIAQEAFKNCKKLTVIDLKGGISDTTTAIGSNAFQNCTQDITVYVYNNVDLAKATAYFASVSNITVVNNSSTASAITSDGYSFRVKDQETDVTKGPALRAEFTILASKVEEASAEGYELLDFGVVVFSQNILDSKFDGDLNLLLAAVQDGIQEEEEKYIKLVSAINHATGVQKLIRVDEEGNRTFGAAITGIPAANYTSEVYTYAYGVWSKNGDTENLEYSYTTYTSERTGKTAHSLYDLTVYKFKIGDANSQNTDADKLWPVLEAGALKVTASQITALPTGLTQAYTFKDVAGTPEDTSDDVFTYVNEPLRAWNFSNWTTSQPDGATAWNSYANCVEATSTTNVLWSILPDGDELVVAYRKDPNAASGATAYVPSLQEGNGAVNPFCTEYFAYTQLENTGVAGVNGIFKGASVYTPIVSATNEAKITTLVIDYGVNNFEARALENTKVPTLHTIVYPEGMWADQSLFQNNYYLSTMFYSSAKKTSLTEATQVENFGKIIDLSGITSFGFGFFFSQARAMENIILPAKGFGGDDGIQEQFYNCNKLKRVWVNGDAVPEAGTLDLTKTKIKKFCKNNFEGLPAGTKILMPAEFVGVANYSIGAGEKDPCAQVFGKDRDYEIVVTTAEGVLGLITYYDTLQANAKNKWDANNLDNLDHLTITYNGTSQGITAWKANPPTVTTPEA